MSCPADRISARLAPRNPTQLQRNMSYLTRQYAHLQIYDRLLYVASVVDFTSLRPSVLFAATLMNGVLRTYNSQDSKATTKSI